MSKRAEERALEAYPYNRAITNNDVEYDGNFCNRLPYTEGYEQAEKDLALTWEDIRAIDELLTLVYDPGNEKDYYQRVLEEFNKKRE